MIIQPNIESDGLNFEKTIENIGAVWLHSGNPLDPHVLLTSGLHSDGYINSTRIIEDPYLLSVVSAELVNRIYPDKEKKRPTWVFGAPFGSITFASYVAHEIRGCRAGFVEAFFKIKRFDVEPGELVLVVDDVITTGETTRKVIDSILAARAIVEDVACIANRSCKLKLDEWPITSLIQPVFNTWSAEECPLCLVGSEALRLKDLKARPWNSSSPA